MARSSAGVCAVAGLSRWAGTGLIPRSGHRPVRQALGLYAGCSQKWPPCRAVRYLNHALPILLCVRSANKPAAPQHPIFTSSAHSRRIPGRHRPWVNRHIPAKADQAHAVGCLAGHLQDPKRGPQRQAHHALPHPQQCCWDPPSVEALREASSQPMYGRDITQSQQWVTLRASTPDDMQAALQRVFIL